MRLLEQMIKDMPYSDGLFFSKYLLLTVPALAFVQEEQERQPGKGGSGSDVKVESMSMQRTIAPMVAIPHSVYNRQQQTGVEQDGNESAV